MSGFVSPKEIKQVCTNPPLNYAQKKRIKKQQPVKKITDIDDEIMLLCVQFLSSEYIQVIVLDIFAHFLHSIDHCHSNVINKIEHYFEKYFDLILQLERLLVKVPSDSLEMPEIFQKYLEVQYKHFKEQFCTHFDMHQDFKQISINMLKDCVMSIDFYMDNMKLNDKWPRIVYVVLNLFIKQVLTPENLFKYLKEIDEVSDNRFFVYIHKYICTFEFNIAKCFILEKLEYRKLIGYNIYRIFMHNHIVVDHNGMWQIRHEKLNVHFVDKLNLFLSKTDKEINYILQTLLLHPMFTKRCIKDYMKYVINDNDASLGYTKIARKIRNSTNYILISIQLVSRYKFIVKYFQRIFW